MDTINKRKKILGVAIGIILVISAIMYYNHANTRKEYNNILTAANEYIDKENYDQAISLYNEALKYKRNVVDIIDKKQLAENLKKDKEIYNSAIKEFNNKNYPKAIETLEKINKEDAKYYSLAQSKISECKKIYIKENLEKANKQIGNEKFDEANKYLDDVLKIDSKNQEVKKLKDTIIKNKKEMSDKEKVASKKKKEIEDKQNTLLKGTVSFVSEHTLKNINNKQDLSKDVVRLININGNKAEFIYVGASSGGTTHGFEGFAEYKGNGKWYFEGKDEAFYEYMIGYLTVYNNGNNAKMRSATNNMEVDSNGNPYVKEKPSLKELNNNKSYELEVIRCDDFGEVGDN